MKAKKPSGPELFMNVTMLGCSLVAIVSFFLFYSGIMTLQWILWCGIVSFMILFHFGLRLLFGKFTAKISFNYDHSFFQTKKFEKKIFHLVRIRKWKDKVLTFDPDAYDFKNRTLEQLAATMCKSETDHWINEWISVFSVLFSLIWGHFSLFAITALLAMLFDAQFILVQRYNRPIVLRHMKRIQKKQA